MIAGYVEEGRRSFQDAIMDYNHKEEAFVTTLTLYNAKKMNSFTSRSTLIAVLIAKLQIWGPARHF